MITVGGVNIFDKLDWYLKPEVSDQARARLTTLMKWLSKNKLLSPLGLELASGKLPSDFTLSEVLLTKEGNSFLVAHYDNWLFGEGTSDPITTTGLDKLLGVKK